MKIKFSPLSGVKAIKVGTETEYKKPRRTNNYEWICLDCPFEECRKGHCDYYIDMVKGIKNK